MKRPSAGETRSDKSQIDGRSQAENAATDLRAVLLDAERSLLGASTRTSRPRLEALLSQAFVEVGASGRRYSRSETMGALAGEAEPAAGTIDDFQLVWHSENAALVSYRYSPAFGGEDLQPSLRVSFWIRDGSAWRILYHQGTLRNASQ